VDAGLAQQSVGLVQGDLPEQAVHGVLNQLLAQFRGLHLQEGALPQQRLEHALLDPEVLPHRPGHGEAGPVGATQHVHHVGDHGGDDLHVVGRHVGAPAQPVRGAEVRHAEAQGEHAVAVLVDCPGDALQGRHARLAVEQLRRLQHRHGEEAAAAFGLGGRQRLQEGDAAFPGELRQDESGQQPDGGSEASDQVGDLLGDADPDEEQRQVRARKAGEGRELADEVLLARADVRVVDRVLQAQDHGDHAATGLLEDVVGEAFAGGRAVERGAEGGREQPGRRIRGERARFAVEEALPHLRGDVPEMTHGTPPWWLCDLRIVESWPVIVRRCPWQRFPSGMNFR
jgi:hypothetical protein